MAQGTRGRWVRVAAAGLGLLVCGGLGGCMNADKDKKDKAVAKPPVTTGLPGLQPIGSNGTASRPGTPAPYTPGGVQQAGAVGQQRVGSPSDGRNTLSNQMPPQTFGNPGFGSGNPVIGAPANPNPASFAPSVAPNPTGGTAPGSWGSTNTTPPAAPANTVAGASPLAIGDMPLPPLPPPVAGSPTAATVAVQPPTVNPLAPVAPGAPPSATARGTGQ